MEIESELNHDDSTSPSKDETSSEDLPKDEPQEYDEQTTNIIGTHPDQIITSTNVENGYPVRQENGQRKTGPPPG